LHPLKSSAFHGALLRQLAVGTSPSWISAKNHLRLPVMHAASQIEHEQETINAFVSRDKQERFLTFLSKPKTRKKLTQELASFTWFDLRFATSIPWKVDPNLGLWQRHLQGIENVHRLLKSKGAGKTCWAISADTDLDGKELELESVLEIVFDSDTGTILSCIPGRLGLYSGEDEKLLLVR
jgi:hypothetical protein